MTGFLETLDIWCSKFASVSRQKASNSRSKISYRRGDGGITRSRKGAQTAHFGQQRPLPRLGSVRCSLFQLCHKSPHRPEVILCLHPTMLHWLPHWWAEERGMIWLT